MTLAAWGCGLATPCLAQPYPVPPGGMSPGHAAAGEVITLPPEAGGYGYSAGAFGDGAYVGGPAGYGAPEYCPPPEPEPWWKAQRCLIDKRWLQPARGAFVRTEYLHWEIEDPGKQFLGASFPETWGPGVELDFDDNPLDIDFDPSEGFFVADSQTSSVGTVYVPSTEEIQFRDNSGFRLTIGIPTYEYGTIEMAGWFLEQGSDQYLFGPQYEDFAQTNFFSDTAIMPVTTGINAAPFDFPSFPNPAISYANDLSDVPVVIGYDQLNMIYTSDMLGGDINFVVDALAPEGEGLKFKPLFGFKYVGLQEFQSVSGFGTTPFVPAFSDTLTSDTANNYLGGTIGLRTEFEHHWFIVGVQPAVTFAGNIASAKVRQTSRVGFSEQTIETESDYFSFSPILDLKAYVRVCLTENLRVNVGYDAFWLAKAYRAGDVIDYRIDTQGGLSQRAASTTREKTDGLSVEGLSVGVEYIF